MGSRVAPMFSFCAEEISRNITKFCGSVRHSRSARRRGVASRFPGSSLAESAELAASSRSVLPALGEAPRPRMRNLAFRLKQVTFECHGVHSVLAAKVSCCLWRTSFAASHCSHKAVSVEGQKDEKREFSDLPQWLVKEPPGAYLPCACPAPHTRLLRTDSPHRPKQPKIPHKVPYISSKLNSSARNISRLSIREVASLLGL